MNKLYFTVGLPASGKSTWAEANKEKLNAIIHSSDAIREELGDVNDQSKNELVFNTLHKRVKEDLINGKNVILDATNLNRRKRIHFLSNELRYVPCEKVCVLFATPYEICLKNNAARDRKVPEHVLEKMIKNFETPCLQEGWDDIQIVWWNYKHDEFDFISRISKDLCEWSTISHDNPHHTLSIGHHMLEAEDYYAEMDIEHLPILYDVIIMHDCGKAFCKAFIDSKGNPSETAHYYQHHNVGAYLSLFYLKEFDMYTDEEILYASLLINLHMHPFLSWKDSEKAKEKDRRLFGDDVISVIELIHECDLAAH